MRIRVLCVGRRAPAWVDAGVAEFLKRFPRQFPVELEAVELAPRKSGHGSARLQQADSERLQARLRGGERLVALDESGRQLDSRGLAERIQDWQLDGRDVVLAIGGPDGHSAGFRAQADELLSLSRLTLPHTLARLLLVEQLYRAWTLISGHPYHRD